MQNSQYENSKVTQLIKPAVVNADANTASFDTQGYGSVLIIAAVGLSADTLNGSNTIQLELEESDNDSDWTDCANVDVDGFVTGTNTGTFAKIDAASEDELPYKTAYTGNKRYVRAVLNFTGTHSTGTPIGVVAVGQDYKYPPVV